MLEVLLLLLPIVAVIGWYVGYKYRSGLITNNVGLPPDYFIGLRYLINEQPDKAVDVFVKMLAVNSDTVETHLALGDLFRRRGEVNRAIRIHQNLIARPQLQKTQRAQALSGLAQDYLRAGVLDRAENLFLELIKLGGETVACYKYLLDIYEQQKEWGQAITIAEKLSNRHDMDMKAAIANYYCELGKPKKALTIDKNCVRASLMQGAVCINDGDYKAAVRTYKKISEQDPDYFSEIVTPLAKCFEHLGSEYEFVNYLRDSLAKHPRISIILALAGYLKQYQGAFAAIEFIVEQMSHYPSLRGLACLTDIYLENSDGNTKRKFLLLQELMRRLLENRPIYRCQQCGFSAKTLYWHCPGCKQWSTIKPIHGLEGD